MYDCNFLLCAVGAKYENFLPLVALSYLLFNENCFVEIVVADAVALRERLRSEWEVLERFYNKRFLLRQFTWDINGHLPNVLRFLEIPEVQAVYTVITDVDIVCLDQSTVNWCQKHLRTTPYVNFVRPDSARMSGVHHVLTKSYYSSKLKNLLLSYRNQQTSHLNDEMILYDLCSKAHGIIDKNIQTRLIAGIHCSVNRLPRSITKDALEIAWSSWGTLHSINFAKLSASEAFVQMKPHLNKDMQSVVKNMQAENTYWSEKRLRTAQLSVLPR